MYGLRQLTEEEKLLAQTDLVVLGQLTPEGFWDCLPGTLRTEKAKVQDFYDGDGWKQDADGEYTDTSLFVDPRFARYSARCRARVSRHIPATGRYLLDVASGPVHFPEYKAYSRGYQHRICVDISTAALREAQRNTNDSGVYVLGDVTSLPFEDDTIDAAVSLHTLYHVPADEQADAFREIHRVLKPGGTAVIAYYWQTTPWRDLTPPGRLLALPGRALSRLNRRAATATTDSLYYFAHTRKWFLEQPWPFEPVILSWSSMHIDTIRRFGPFAGPLTRLLARLEEQAPRFMGRFGYPMIVIRKDG